MLQHIAHITMNSGRNEEVYYVVDGNKFRFVLDDKWREVQEGESLDDAILREWSDVCKNTWPDNPEYWVREPEPFDPEAFLQSLEDTN